MRVASMGYQHVVADLIWLQAIQAMAGQKVPEESGRWIYHALDVVTTLDPRFVQAYQAGAIALCTMVVMPDESNALLEKGIRNNPQEWMLYFLLGINYYFEFHNDAKAAEYIAQAARLPLAPGYLAPFAARLYASAREPQAAIGLLTHMYEQTNDENVKRVLEQRLREVLVERDIQLLETAVAQYVKRNTKPLTRLEELVVSGLISELPREPFGGTYVYDQQTRMVTSSVMTTRLQALGRRRVK
ncbi:MAG: hypothetical protein ABL983_01050 [Nitrospira sp.]